MSNTNEMTTRLTQAVKLCTYCGREFRTYRDGAIPNHAAPKWARELPGRNPRWDCRSWGASSDWIAPVVAMAVSR